jgi:hypothetical protein
LVDRARVEKESSIDLVYEEDDGVAVGEDRRDAECGNQSEGLS